MARKRTVLPSAIEAEIEIRTSRGETAATIFEAIHGAISKPTIARRQRELRGKDRRPQSAASATAPKPESIPENLPENAPVEDLDRWIATFSRAAKQAEDDKNLPALATIATKVTALLALKQKHTPLPKADPSNDPDYRALAKAGEDKLLQKVRGIFATV